MDSSLKKQLVFLSVAIVAIAGAAFFVTGRTGTPSETSADAGFARDMAAHHAQAVTMSFTIRDKTTTTPDVRNLAFDIIYTQANQRGMFLGWLQQWELPQTSDLRPMAWMSGHGHAQRASQPAEDTNAIALPVGRPPEEPVAQSAVQAADQATARSAGQPAAQPAAQSTGQSAEQPIGQPTGQPVSEPSGRTTPQPSQQPSQQAGGQSAGGAQAPTAEQPTTRASGQSTAQPSGQATAPATAPATGQPSPAGVSQSAPPAPSATATPQASRQPKPPQVGVMPGMATRTELNRLKGLTGRTAEVYFLQLMIRHHEGGVQMAEALLPLSTRNEVMSMAQKIVDGQKGEIKLMTDLLRHRGAQPLPSIL
jgi:uncharacterized protein (DUF305 family)